MFGPLPPPSLPHLVLLQVRPIARVIRLAHPAANEDMEMMFEAEESLSPEEVTAVKENARTRLKTWTQRAAYSGALLLISCAVVVPFSQGHSLHVYWDSFGKYLGIVVMGAFLLFVYCAALCWGAWSMLRNVEKTYS